jgi:hypothetical protein
MSQYGIIKDTGSKHRQISDGCKFLLAMDKNVAVHVKFLKTVPNIRISGNEHPLLYLEKTGAYQNHFRKNIWQDVTGKGSIKVQRAVGS